MFVAAIGDVRDRLAALLADAGTWDGRDRSAAHWYAREAGTSVGEAEQKLETAQRLDDLPSTAEAFRAGKLSEQQVRHVSIGAAADPRAEHDLLETAATDSLKELRDQARRAQAVDDEAARQARIHADRGLWSQVDSDGTFRLWYRGAPESGSEILRALKPYTEQAFTAARAEGRRNEVA